MNTTHRIFLLLAIFGLGGVVSFAVTEVMRPAIPVVNNRDAKGRFMTPDCPLCEQRAVASAVKFRCVNDHVFETRDVELKPAGDSEFPKLSEPADAAR